MRRPATTSPPPWRGRDLPPLLLKSRLPFLGFSLRQTFLPSARFQGRGARTVSGSAPSFQVGFPLPPERAPRVFLFPQLSGFAESSPQTFPASRSFFETCPNWRRHSLHYFSRQSVYRIAPARLFPPGLISSGTQSLFPLFFEIVWPHLTPGVHRRLSIFPGGFAILTPPAVAL